MNDSTEVKLHFLDYWRVVKARWGIITLVFLLTVIAAGITVYFLPRQYFSQVLIEVKPDEARAVEFGVPGYRAGSDQKLAPTQFQILQSKDILYPVIKNLGLAAKWGNVPDEQAYIRLRRMMEMREIRNTDLIAVGVYSTDNKEAATIANLIAVVYKDKRRGDQMKRIETALAQLQEQVNDQRKKVEQAGTEAAKLRSELGIVDPDPDSMGNTQDIETQTVRTAEAQAEEARLSAATLQTQLRQIDKLKPAELPVVLPMLGINDQTIMKVTPLYQEAVVDEARLLNSGLGPNHPKIKSLRATKDVYAQQLSEQLDAVRASLRTKLAIAESTETTLEEKLANTRENFTKTKDKNTDYIEAKSRYVQAKRLLESAEQQIAQERIRIGVPTIPAEIREMAEPSLAPAKPNVIAYMTLATVVGLILGVGLAFFIEYLDTSVKTVEDVEKFLGIPVLAVVPKNVGVLMHQTGGADTAHAEAYRILRTNIEFNRKNPNANTITIVSGGPGEGKSTTLNNLAFTCAKGGYNVLVVDADLRRPSQHKIFNVNNDFGLTNYLTNNIPISEIIRSTGVENLSFIPSGVLPRDAVGVLNSQRMIDLIGRLKRQFDLVFFDSPPILGVSDATVLASELDLCVMVVEHRRFPRSMLQRVKQGVTSVGGNLLGVVLNKVDVKHDATYGYYTSYYDYVSPQAEEKPRPAAAAAKVVTPAPAPRPLPTGGEQY